MPASAARPRDAPPNAERAPRYSSAPAHHDDHLPGLIAHAQRHVGRQVAVPSDDIESPARGGRQTQTAAHPDAVLQPVDDADRTAAVAIARVDLDAGLERLRDGIDIGMREARRDRDIRKTLRPAAEAARADACEEISRMRQLR